MAEYQLHNEKKSWGTLTGSGLVRGRPGGDWFSLGVKKTLLGASEIGQT